MIDYIVRFTYWIDDLEFSSDKVITIQEGHIEDQELLEDVLLEILKEEIDNENIVLIDFEEITDRDYDIYKLTY